MRRCFYCGATENLINDRAHVGGQGYVERMRCADFLGCEIRADNQNSIPHTPGLLRAIKEREAARC